MLITKFKSKSGVNKMGFSIGNCVHLVNYLFGLLVLILHAHLEVCLSLLHLQLAFYEISEKDIHVEKLIDKKLNLK